MEGVSDEAASIAGHQRLDNLCWIYDNNHISIDGHTELAYTDDVAARFMGYGWNVTRVGDANDLELLDAGVRALPQARATADADHRRQPHRLRLAAQAGHRGGARRAARRGGGARDEAHLRLARGRRVPGSRRRLRALRRRDRRPRRASCARSGRQRSSATDASTRRWRRRSTRCSAASCRRAGTPRSRASTPTRRGSRPARPRTRC